MRSFEEIPDIAERIKRSKMELQESGFYLAPEWDSQSCCDQDYVNNFKKGWESRQTEVDELTLQVAEMKSRLNDVYTDGQSAMYAARQSEIDELQKQRDSFIKAYEIEIDENVELQKRVDAVKGLAQTLWEKSEEKHQQGKVWESKTLGECADEILDVLEQALKGGSNE